MKTLFLTPKPLGELDQWIQDLITLWDSRLLSLKNFVESENDTGYQAPTGEENQTP